jgi:hypothetical protein
MLQFLPAIAGLLQNKQKQAEQAKQDEIAAYMGHAPGSGGGGGSDKSGLLQGLGGLLGGLGGGKKKSPTPVPGPGPGPVPGPGGGKIDTENPYGPAHSEPDGDEYGGANGPQDNDDEYLL